MSDINSLNTVLPAMSVSSTGGNTALYESSAITSATGVVRGGKRKAVLKKTLKRNKTRKWSQKYKKSIDCKRPKGFSQKQYCKPLKN